MNRYNYINVDRQDKVAVKENNSNLEISLCIIAIMVLVIMLMLMQVNVYDFIFKFTDKLHINFHDLNNAVGNLVDAIRLGIGGLGHQLTANL